MGTREIQLESLAFGGDAVGRLDGKVVFVPFGAPGDRVEIQIIEEHRSYSRGRLLAIRQPSNARRQSQCHYFGSCGGCQWQHLSYEGQLEAKQAIVAEALRRHPGLQLAPIVGAMRQYGYRRRVRMVWRPGAGRALLGLFRRGSRDLLDIDSCPLLTGPLQRAVRVCRRWLDQLQRGGGTVSLLVGRGGAAHLSLRLHQDSDVPDPALLLDGAVVGGQIARRDESPLCFGEEAVDIGESSATPLWASAAAFAQANAEQDEILGRRVVSWAQPRGLRVLELHAGIGNFTRRIARCAPAALVAVEAAPVACKLLARNLHEVDSKIIAEDVSVALARLVERRERFDVVVLDPPREGCRGVGRLIAALEPRRVVYVSCDPMTLARDLSQLGAAGLAVREVGAYDMMPQTFHAEVVTLLEPSRGGQ